jgi:hypothetical protein
MDSVCAIKRTGIATNKVFTVYEDIDGDNQFTVELPREVDTQFNVIAVVENSQQAIPYRPINIRVPNRPAYGGNMFITLLLGVIVLFACFALYFFLRNRKLQARLHEEVRDVGSLNGNGNLSYRRVKDEGISIE